MSKMDKWSLVIAAVIVAVVVVWIVVVSLLP